ALSLLPSLKLQRLASSPLFPSTTLFRSGCCPRRSRRKYDRFRGCRFHLGQRPRRARSLPHRLRPNGSTPAPRRSPAPGQRPQPRSEEHTSELQSREKLVCRLLLEKKNIK